MNAENQIYAKIDEVAAQFAIEGKLIEKVHTEMAILMILFYLSTNCPMAVKNVIFYKE